MSRKRFPFFTYRSDVVAKTTCLLLLFLAFFGLKLFPMKPSHWDFVLLPLLLALTAGFITGKTLYAKFIIAYVLFVTISCLYSHFYNYQALHLVVVHSYKYFSLLFFFYLLHTKHTAIEAERILITVAIICCCCYILQWLIYPIVLFEGANDEAKASLEYYRVRMPGSIGCYCLLFYGINKYILSKDLKYIVYSIIGFIPIIIMGFRTLTFLSAVLVFLIIPFVIRSGKKTMFYSLLGAVCAMGVMRTNLVQTKMEEMEARQVNQTFENENYVRYMELDYYWNDHINKPGEKIIGGGVPVDMTTKYRRDIYYNDYAWSDLGLVGLSMIIGVPAVSLLVLLYLICIWRLKEPQHQYLRFTLLIALLGSVFTTAELYRDGNILLFSLFLYIEYQYHTKSKRPILLSKSTGNI